MGPYTSAVIRIVGSPEDDQDDVNQPTRTTDCGMKQLLLPVALPKLRSIVHEAIVRRELTGEADSRLLSGLLESERRWSSQ
jgi:hypothetical protein